jgi:hypothetical protein
MYLTLRRPFCRLQPRVRVTCDDGAVYVREANKECEEEEWSLMLPPSACHWEVEWTLGAEALVCYAMENLLSDTTPDIAAGIIAQLAPRYLTCTRQRLDIQRRLETEPWCLKLAVQNRLWDAK